MSVVASARDAVHAGSSSRGVGGAENASGSGDATGSALPLIVYFSSVSENTRRFVDKLGGRSRRIPLHDPEGAFEVNEPYVLISPTYGGGKSIAMGHQAGSDTGKSGGHVPKQVIRFLNNPRNRSLIRGVLAAGNTNFGEDFCVAGDIIAAKCEVPYLYRFELMGTAEDVDSVRAGLTAFAAGPAFTR